jgi:hypothetical protein
MTDKTTVQRNYKLAAVLVGIFLVIFVVSMVLTYTVTH